MCWKRSEELPEELAATRLECIETEPLGQLELSTCLHPSTGIKIESGKWREEGGRKGGRKGGRGRGRGKEGGREGGRERGAYHPRGLLMQGQPENCEACWHVVRHWHSNPGVSSYLAIGWLERATLAAAGSAAVFGNT